MLGGLRARPRPEGTYKLVICYKHKGHVFYKEYVYDAGEKLVLPSVATTDSGDILPLLISNRNNLSFVGERLRISKDEFLARFNRLPVLGEVMRMHISVHGALTPKSRRNLVVKVVHRGENVATVNFAPDAAPAGDFGEDFGDTPGNPTPGNPTPGEGLGFQKMGDEYVITQGQVFNEDTLAEIKGRILSAVQQILNKMLAVDPSAHIPPGLDPSTYLNHALQFFDDIASGGPEGANDYLYIQRAAQPMDKRPLNDYSRLTAHVWLCITE